MPDKAPLAPPLFPPPRDEFVHLPPAYRPYDATNTYASPEVVLFLQVPSVFSQWTPSAYIIGCVTQTCIKQYFMASRIRLFGDERSRIAIMHNDNPRTHKHLGRGVPNCEHATWEPHRESLVLLVTCTKFSQSAPMRQCLLSTDSKSLGDASPFIPGEELFSEPMTPTP